MQQERNKFTSSIIPELVSGSSTHAALHGTTKRQASKTLKQVQGLSHLELRKNKIKCHSQKFLLGISLIRFRKGMFGRLVNIGNKQAGDPRQQHSGMTTLCNERAFTLNRQAESSLLSISTAQKAQGRDPEQKHLRMALCKGFTLIELLVVVLIIGVLAAIAVPQYRKALERARGREAMGLVKTMFDAQQYYKLVNGDYATQFEQLDVQLPAVFTACTSNTRVDSSVNDCRANTNWSLGLFAGQITATRLTGPYRGIMFSMVAAPNTNWRIPFVMECMELKDKNIYNKKIFQGSPGEYCQKIFHGTILYDGSARVYSISNSY